MKSPLTVVLDEAGIEKAVADLAVRLALQLKPDAVAVCLLSGGIWFAADLTRALAKLDLPLAFDALWLSSYGDGQIGGEMILRADHQRPVNGRQVLLMDDILDTGASLKFARDHFLRAGAVDVVIAVMACKPCVLKSGLVRSIEADYVAWDAPDRYLVGYGLDSGGLYRGLPYIAALD
jgi:hypoxanthine phosphoribosyltransferase